MNASALLLPSAMAVAAGLVGSVAVMRRMSLAGDALSHVALPGIGLALILQLNPLLGAVAMLLVGALLIWGIEQRTHISTETVTGVVFSTALAVGSMLATGEDLIDALFGESASTGGMEVLELAIGLVLALGIIVFMLATRSRLVLMLVSPEIAHTSGISAKRLNLLFLLAFASTVALGLRYLGVLLMGSLIIIPAATARRLARNLNELFAAATSIALLSTIAGFFLAPLLGQTTGPVIVTISGVCFGASLLIKPRQ